jgi:hypothetical protein
MSTFAPVVGPGFVRRNRVALGFTVAVLAVLITLSWLGRDQGGRGGALDPENPKPGGARAVAQVLADHGVPVRIVRGKKALDRTALDDRTTVVVSNTGSLAASTWSDLDVRAHTSGSVLVVVGLSPVVVDGLGLGDQDLVEPGGPRTQAADCDPEQGLMAGLSLTSDRDFPTVKGDGCFGTAAGRQLLVDRQQHRWVLTNPHPLSNADVDRGDNAAVVLRLLGQRDRVVWYVADSADTLASDGVGLGRLLPRWLVPSLWLLGLSALALLLWRGRRLGPLVVEPLPVAIKALESTSTLGRLYERARDRRHAAGLLVEGTAGRLVGHLGLDPDVTRTELVRMVAERTGRPADAVAALLPEPAQLQVNGDADLVELAQNLTQLEEEVRSR